MLALGAGGIVFGCTGFVLAPWVVDLLGGDAFSQSVPVLRILISGLVVFYLTQPLSWLILTLGKQKYLPWVYLASAVFDIIANIIFIPLYSFYASAVITIISEGIILVLLFIAAFIAWRTKFNKANVSG
jgi:O-antigen/teichoic acid export membrane protein